MYFFKNKPKEVPTKIQKVEESVQETIQETVHETVSGYCGTFVGAERSLTMINKNTALFYSYTLKENEIYEEVEYYIEDNNVILNTSKIFNFKIYFEKKDKYFDDISYDLKSTNEKWKTEKIYKWSDRFDYSKDELKNITRSSKAIKKMDVDLLKKMLDRDQYTNVVLSPMYDIVFGVNYAGEIDRVTVDGETKFDSYLEFPKD